MFLKHLSLENIRCFEQAELDFDLPGGDNRKWTVLLGENGDGKTTVLKSIALTLAGSSALGQVVGEPDDWIRHGAEGGKITLSFETARGRVREIWLEFRRGESKEAFLKRAPEGLERLDKAHEHTFRSYLTVAYGASRRLSRAQSDDGKRRFTHPRARSMASLFDREAELNPLESWAMGLETEEGDGKPLEVVQQVLGDFLHDARFSHVDEKRGSFMFETPDGVMPLRRLSSGYQSVAAWVGDLLFQVVTIFGDHKNPLNARGLLLIDTVDLGLHIKWQRQLLDFLDAKLPRLQLVVTTHSVVTAQQSPPGALHYCVRRPEGLKIEVFEGDPGKLLLNQLITTEAFGNASDESLSVERDKQEYRQLHKKKRKSAADRKRMEQIADRLGRRPEDLEESVFLNAEQRDLMKKIQQQYQGQG